MNILRAAHLGMCFGVRDAIAIAHHEARRQPVTVLGQLVHNPAVLRDLESRQVQIVNAPAEVRTPTVLITAHGASDKARHALTTRGLDVIETTCPLVRHAHEALAALIRAGCHPVIIGQRHHVEVRGLTEDLADFDVILTEADIDGLVERPRYGVVAQTTQPLERAERLVAALRLRFPAAEVRFSDTVCRPTKQRQQAAIDLARQCDVVVVVGGTNSNNTRELAATCRRYCARVHQIEGAAELQPGWFARGETVGLTAGTSTPDLIIDGVEQALRSLAADRGMPDRATACGVWGSGPTHRPVSEPAGRAVSAWR